MEFVRSKVRRLKHWTLWTLCGSYLSIQMYFHELAEIFFDESSFILELKQEVNRGTLRN